MKAAINSIIRDVNATSQLLKHGSTPKLRR